MGNKGRYSFADTLKQILSYKRTKVTAYIVVVLWLAVGTQMFVNKMFHKDFVITEAFVKTNAEEMQSNIELITEYEKEFLSESDKKELIYYLAETIGLEVDKEITVSKENNRSEYSFQKDAKSASTELKVVSMEQKEDNYIKMRHYIIVKLNIKKSIESVEHYKQLIEKALNKIGVGKTQITMQYTGSYLGRIDTEQKREMANDMIHELQGETAIEYEEGNVYTAYAYTGMIKEYIVSAGNKVNIQIAITYDESADKTTVYLATPILNQSW
ncbi:MAG: putative rane protein [Herbinix sp.]|jgi:hypothetical protein|nr:putative rane protein [Herbinix sp.]